MKMKTAIIGLVLILLLIGGTGCSMRHEKADDIILQIEDYLEDKYGYFSYEVTGFIASGWDHKYDCLNFNTEYNGQASPACAKRYSDSEGVRFEDNYFGILIKKEYEDYISSCAAKYFEDFFVDASTVSVCYPNELDSDSSFDDLLAVKDEIKESITIVVVVKDDSTNTETFEDNAKKFCSEWKKVGLPTSFRIIRVSDETYSEINQTNFRQKGVLTDNKLYEYSE